MRFGGGGYDGAKCKRQREKGAWCGSACARVSVWLVERRGVASARMATIISSLAGDGNKVSRAHVGVCEARLGVGEMIQFPYEDAVFKDRRARGDWRGCYTCKCWLLAVTKWWLSITLQNQRIRQRGLRFGLRDGNKRGVVPRNES